MLGRLPTRLTVFFALLAFVALAGGAITAGVATTDAPTVTDTGLAVDADSDTGPVADAETDLASARVAQEDIETDRIRIDITLNEDGSADWRVEFWSVLDDDDTEAAFESIRGDIADDPDNYTASFATGIDETVETASQSTGREMTATEFSVETDRQSLGREYGIISYSFEWSGFGTVDGDTIQAGDAIDGLFLDDGSRLLISWPDAYERQSVTPEPDDERANAVLWRGSSTEFLAGEPRLTVSQPLLGVGSGTLAVSLALTAIILAVAGWLLRRQSTTDQTPPPAAEVGDNPEPTDSASPEADESSTTEPDATDDPSTAVDPEQAADEAPSTAGQSADTAAEPDPELLSNEEQVMRLIEANGGRMKQQTVVQELGWTDAKTSKVVSTLREEGELESFRIGRENVLRVPDDEERSSL